MANPNLQSQEEEHPPLFLYDHPVSSYAQKVRITLREKSVRFTSQIPTAIATGRPEPEFQSANPRLEVPTLVDGDLRILDSTIILEYLEDKYPEPALLPSPPRVDPAGRAKARMIEEICDTQYEAVNWGWGEIVWFGRADGQLAESMKAKVVEQTGVIHAWLTERLGDEEYFGGKTFGWADVCAAPLVNRSRFYGTGPEEGSALSRWLERVSGRPSVKETFAEFEAAAAKMSGMSDAYKSGTRKREYRDHRLEWMIKSGGIEIVQEGLKQNNIRFSWP